MEVFATIVMLAWIPTVLVLFAVVPPQRAVLVAMIGAWLFLPVVAYRLPFLPDYTKVSATCAGVFLGALIFDAKRIVRFLPGWVDLPVAMFCACPLASSLVNGLGLWDGVSGVLNSLVSWGLPYLIGRIYFTDAKGLRELAIGLFIGGLLYVPLCMFEIRMSPKLHSMVYGFAPREVQMRFGGWRPNVFMDGGLQVGLWMTAASLAGLWLWWKGAVKKLWGLSMSGLVLVLFATTVLCRSTGALALLFLNMAALGGCMLTKNRLVLIGLVLLPPTYVALRTSGLWHGEQIVELARILDSNRADSLQFRINNENILLAKALQQPIFGWGGWGRGRVYDEWDNDVSITDGRWIIELGAHGIVGVASCFAAMLLPLALLTTRFPARRLLSTELAPALALAMIVMNYAFDSLPNSMANPVFMFVGGAVISFSVARGNAREAIEQDEYDPTNKEPAESIPLRRLHPGSV